MFVHRLRVGELFDVPFEHDGDAVAHTHGFFLVVGDEDEGDAEAALQQLQFDLHLFTQFAVERTQRFVEQQHARSVHQRACHRDTLLLAARHLARFALGEFAHLHHVERFGHAGGDLALRHTPLAQAVGHVLGNRHVREQRVGLEHGVHIALVRRYALHIVAADADEAFIGLFEAGEHAQRGGLPTARGAEQRQEFTGTHREIEVVDRNHGAEPLGDAHQFNRATFAHAWGTVCSRHRRWFGHAVYSPESVSERLIGALVPRRRASRGLPEVRRCTVLTHRARRTSPRRENAL